MVLEFLDIMLILIGMLLLLQICGRIYLAHEQGITCTAVCCRGSQPTTKYAIILVCLSVIVAFTGNVFLSFVGVFTGCICLRLETFERSPDLIYMMSLVTATAAVLYILGLLPFGIYLLGASQEHVCGASESMVARVTGSNFAQAYIPASGQEAVEKKIGYPWNVTERAQGHATTSYDAYTYSPNVISTVKGISGVVCGENGVAYLRAAGGLVFLYCLLVVLPICIYALKLKRAASHAGGCAGGFLLPRVQYVTVPAGVYQQRQHHGGGGGGGPSGGGAGSSNGMGPNGIAIAKAVPVAQQATSVRVAPNEMR